MASPSPYTRRRSPPNAAASAAPPSVVTPRSKGGFFCKSILFTLFLLALPLFPSQAPDFVGETVLTKFWELIHLLFVGIAVAYGLFSRRSVESRTRSGVVDESSLSYVSRIFPVSSVFDEDSCDFRSDETRLVHVSGRGSVGVVDERESESLNQVQAWNSQCFQGRSKVVVVARPDYGLDGHVAHRSLGLPVRSLRSGLRDNAAMEDSSCDEAVNEKAEEESLADKDFDEVVAAPPSPPVVPWHSRPDMMAMGDGYLSNFHPLSVDETNYATLESRSSQSTVSSSSSSRTSFESHTQNRSSPSRSVSEESLKTNVNEAVEEKSFEGSSRSSSPSLPPSPPLYPSPPLVNDDTHTLVLHSRHCSDGSLLEEDVRQGLEDELKGSEVRGRRTQIFSKKELGSKLLKLTAESSRKGKNKSRRSYPPNTDDSTTRRRDIQRKSDGHLLEDNIRKGLESDHNKLRVKKGRSQHSLELPAEASSLTIPPVDVLFQPTNPKASRRAIRSSREGRDTLRVKEIKRNSEDEFLDLDKSRKKDLPGDNKEVKSSSPRRSSPEGRDTLPVKDIKRNSGDDLMDLDKSRKKDHPCDNKEVKLSIPRREPQSWRNSSKVSSSSPRRAMRSSREGRDTLPVKEIKRNSEDDFTDLDKSRKKDHPGDNKEVSRASSKVSSRGKSVRTIRSDHHKKDPRTDGDSSHDRTEAKVESHGRTKPRRQWKEELAIVLHQEKLSETHAKSEPEDDDVTKETEVEQLQLTLEEEEEAAAAWESQSNASHEHYEVDRKADEFIAKFREQIRLQKLHSGEQPRGGGGTGIIRNSHFR